ncbi:MAG: undecaprenyl-diphosphatase [Thermoanaerobacteraceae bacterium]
MNLELFQLINGISGHVVYLDKLMIFIAKYSPLLYAFLLITQWLFRGDYGKKASINAVFAGILALGINLLISTIYFEPRPFVNHKDNLLIKHPADASFPSDHASGGSAFAFTELIYDKIFGKIMMILTLLVLFARVYVGVHYPIDVLGGFLIGYISSRVIKKFNQVFNPLELFIIKIWHKIFVF